MNRLIPNRERAIYLAIFALMAGGFLIAETVTGPFTVTDSSGAIQASLNTDGSLRAKSTRKLLTSTNYLEEASDGTDVGGFTEKGVPMYLVSGEAYGTFTSAAAGNDPTAPISATFTTAEGDVVTPNAAPGYEILLVTTGVTAGYSATKNTSFIVGDKYAASFEIRNPAGLEPPIGGTWFKFRKTNISP